MVMFHMNNHWPLLLDLSKVISKRQMLDAQLSENKSVIEELNSMNSENKVTQLESFTRC